MNKALVVVDMQTMPFVWKNYGGKAVFKEEELIKKTKQLIDKARKSDVPIYYVMFTEGEGSHRMEGEPLWQLHPEIIPNPEEEFIVKYHADSFYETDLKAKLIDKEIDSIVLCGLQTEFCVDTTCRIAFSHGFKVELVADGHSTFEKEGMSADQIIKHHNECLLQFAEIKPMNLIEF